MDIVFSFTNPIQLREYYLENVEKMENMERMEKV